MQVWLKSTSKLFCILACVWPVQRPVWWPVWPMNVYSQLQFAYLWGDNEVWIGGPDGKIWFRWYEDSVYPLPWPIVRRWVGWHWEGTEQEKIWYYTYGDTVAIRGRGEW